MTALLLALALTGDWNLSFIDPAPEPASSWCVLPLEEDRPWYSWRFEFLDAPVPPSKPEPSKSATQPVAIPTQTRVIRDHRGWVIGYERVQCANGRCGR